MELRRAYAAASTRLICFVIASSLLACDDGEEADLCGNGVIDEGEDCDPRDDGTRCNDSCEPNVGYACDDGACAPICGDSRLTSDEVCDVGETPNYCSADCSEIVAWCGDGARQWPEEQCDGVRGCGAECRAAFGFHCAAGGNACEATGLPGDLLLEAFSDEQVGVWCEWLNGLLGGTGATFTCDGTSFVILSPAECVLNTRTDGWPEDMGTCTVAEVEDWVATGDRCDLMTSLPPCGA